MHGGRAAARKFARRVNEAIEAPGSGGLPLLGHGSDQNTTIVGGTESTPSNTEKMRQIVTGPRGTNRLIVMSPKVAGG